MLGRGPVVMTRQLMALRAQDEATMAATAMAALKYHVKGKSVGPQRGSNQGLEPQEMLCPASSLHPRELDSQ